MSYKKIFDTFPTKLSKYSNSIFTLKSDLKTFVDHDNITIDLNEGFITGSTNKLHVTSSISVKGNISLSENFEVTNEIDINDTIIKLENSQLKIDANNITYNVLDVSGNATINQITGNLVYVDPQRQQKLITGDGGCEVSFNENKFEFTRRNNTNSKGSVNEITFTCSPGDGITDSILEPHYLRHDTSDSNVASGDKYNIRSNAGTHTQYCTNTAIIRPGYGGLDTDFVRSFAQGTSQGFRFKNVSVLPGWTTGSNNVIGNGDIYWPVTIDDDVKKSSQTVILDFSLLLENNLLLPGKSIKIFLEDDYDVENTYPLLIKKDSSSEKYLFPSGSTSFGDDSASGGGNGNNLSRCLTKCTFDKDDLDGDSTGEDDLSGIRGSLDPVLNSVYISDASPFAYPSSGFFGSKFNGNTLYASQAVNNDRKIQNNNIGISTIKPRFMLGLGDNYKIINENRIPRFFEVSSSLKLTKSPPVLAKFERANEYRFFNTYPRSTNNPGGYSAVYRMHPSICHKVFPDVFESSLWSGGSYFKDKKIEYNEIKSETGAIEKFCSDNGGLTRYNKGFKIAGFEIYTVLSSSFYYDIKNDNTINKFLKFNSISYRNNQSYVPLIGAPATLDFVFPYVGLKEKNNSNSHSLGNNIKNKYTIFRYNSDYKLKEFKNPVNAYQKGDDHRSRRSRSSNVGNVLHRGVGSRYGIFYEGINSNIPSHINSHEYFYRNVKLGSYNEINDYYKYFFGVISSFTAHRENIGLKNERFNVDVITNIENFQKEYLSTHYVEHSPGNRISTIEFLGGGNSPRFVYYNYPSETILNTDRAWAASAYTGNLIMTYRSNNERSRFENQKASNVFTLTYLGTNNNVHEWAIT